MLGPLFTHRFVLNVITDLIKKARTLNWWLNTTDTDNDLKSHVVIDTGESVF